MRLSCRRVTAVALLVFGMGLAPLSARPAQAPRRVDKPAASSVALFWSRMLHVLGLQAEVPASSPNGACQATSGYPTLGCSSPLDDSRSGFDPNGAS